jgi:hypothetical protein
LFDVIALAALIYRQVRVLSSLAMGHWNQPGGRVAYVGAIVADGYPRHRPS